MTLKELRLVSLEVRPRCSPAFQAELVQSSQAGAPYWIRCVCEPPFARGSEARQRGALVLGDEAGELTSALATAQAACEGLVIAVTAQGSWSWELALDEGEVKALLARLAAARIAAVPETMLGLDGTTFMLEFGRGLNSARFTWWAVRPAGWEPLTSAAADLVRWSRLETIVGECVRDYLVD